MNLTGSEEDVLGSTVDADKNLSNEATQYIRKKIASTRETAIAYCKHMNTDFVIVEGGVSLFDDAYLLPYCSNSILCTDTHNRNEFRQLVPLSIQKT